MSRLELYFGGRPGDAEAWRRFVVAVVTPRFPDGLTDLTGVGQWRGPRGVTHETTHVLIIYYRRGPTSDARIEAIRSAYAARFHQMSVMRADTSACVSF